MGQEKFKDYLKCYYKLFWLSKAWLAVSPMYLLLPDVDFPLYVHFQVVNKQYIKLLFLMEAVIALELKGD